MGDQCFHNYSDVLELEKNPHTSTDRLMKQTEDILFTAHHDTSVSVNLNTANEVIVKE